MTLILMDVQMPVKGGLEAAARDQVFEQGRRTGNTSYRYDGQYAAGRS